MAVRRSPCLPLKVQSPRSAVIPPIIKRVRRLNAIRCDGSYAHDGKDIAGIVSEESRDRVSPRRVHE